MFKIFMIGAVFVGAFATVVEDNHGHAYYLIPHQQHSRNRRESETTAGVDNNGAIVKHQQIIVDNDKYKLEASTRAQRNYHPKGPLTTGNQVDYSYKPTDSGFSVLPQNTRGQGTDAQARGTYNFFQTRDKKGTDGLSATYDQHFGGHQGTRQAGYGVLLHGRYDF